MRMGKEGRKENFKSKNEGSEGGGEDNSISPSCLHSHTLFSLSLGHYQTNEKIK